MQLCCRGREQRASQGQPAFPVVRFCYSHAWRANAAISPPLL